MSAIIRNVGVYHDDGYRRVRRNAADEAGTEIRVRGSVTEVTLSLRGDGESMCVLMDLAASLRLRMLGRLEVNDEALRALAEVMRVPEAER